MNQEQSNYVGCCGQEQQRSPIPNLSQLRAAASEITTPNVTVSLDEYKTILDGFTAHSNVVLRQKKAIEAQLVSARLLAVETLEMAEGRIRELSNTIETQRGIATLKEIGRECLVAQVNRANDRIAELEKALRSAKRARK